MIQKTGGIMTNNDLESYAVRIAPALKGTYQGRKVYTSHAPTSGPVLLHMLNLLEQYDLPGEGRTGLNVHRLVEVLKCEYYSPNFMKLGIKIPPSEFSRIRGEVCRRINNHERIQR